MYKKAVKTMATKMAKEKMPIKIVKKVKKVTKKK